MDGNLTIDILIPTYKPDDTFIRLLSMLSKQSVQLHRIIVANTEEKYWKDSYYDALPDMEVIHIRRKDFDHGGTRRMLADASNADIMVFMTQDAVPADENTIENLVKPLAHPNVKAAYARQLADDNSRPIERFTRGFNYPKTAAIKEKEDLERLGIKTFFCSNVCAAYEKETYEALGGFVTRAIFNEDMIYGAHLIENECAIAYAAEAKVFHSHNYNWRSQFHRNFDLGVSQSMHPEIFHKYRSEGEGIRLVKKTAAYLIDNKKKRWLVSLFFQSGFKYLGYLLGKSYHALPPRLVRAFSMNKGFWDTEFSK